MSIMLSQKADPAHPQHAQGDISRQQFAGPDDLHCRPQARACDCCLCTLGLSVAAGLARPEHLQGDVGCQTIHSTGLAGLECALTLTVTWICLF